MISPVRKSPPLFKIANNALVNMPLPSNITVFWNFESHLGLCLMLQTVTGLFLAMHYVPHIDMAFSSVPHTCRDYGWLLQTTHANGASFFFVCLYTHVGQSMFYGSYMIFHKWMVGMLILLMLMATAFLGYLLPWG